VDYSLEHTLEAPFRDSFEFVKGEIKDVRGCWELYPVDGGKKTALFYRTWGDLKSMGFLAKKLYNEQPALETATQVLTAALAAKGMKEWVELPPAERGKKKETAEIKMVDSEPIPAYKGTDLTTLMKILKNGDVTIIKAVQPGHRQFITSVTLVNKSVEKVYNTIVDYDHFQEFMPQVENVVVKPGKSANEADTEFHLKIMVGFVPLRYEYTMHSVYTPPTGMTWTLVKGEMKENTGSWEIYPIGDDNRSIAFYTLYADLKSMGGVVKYIMKQQPALEISTQITTGTLTVKVTRERAESVDAPAPGAKKDVPAGKKKGSSTEEKF